MKKSYIAGICLTAAALIAVPALSGRAEEQVTVNFDGSTVTTNDSDRVKISRDDGAADISVMFQEAGTYVLEGKSDAASITVKKNAGDVTLILNGVSIHSEDGAVIATKSGTNVTVTAAAGTKNSLSDTDRGGEKPKSAINASADLTLNGTGSLNVTANNKNGIKSDTNVTIDGLNLDVTSADHGIVADNELTVKSGDITVVSGGDAMRSSPDEITEDTAGNVVICDGTFDLTAAGDGIQADADLTVQDGTFHVVTNGGHTTTLASDSDSCKGLKAAEKLMILDGTFDMDTADDAFHSNNYCYLTKGSLTISTGDDVVHADTSLLVGEENGSDDDLYIKVNSCYEGLEAGTVYIYSGNIDVTSTDDGINAAGGSGSGGTQPGGDGFRPGGGVPGGGPGGNGGGQMPGSGTSSSDYSIQIMGGNIWVNAEGDGLDSNGDLMITGGNLVVLGAASNGSTSDNSALDYDGTGRISGATILAAGSAQMAQTPSISGQSYVSVRQQVNKGKYINITAGGETVFSVLTPKQVNHVFFTSPDLSGGASVSSADQPGTTAAVAPTDKTGSSVKEPKTRESETETKATETKATETDAKQSAGETKTPQTESTDTADKTTNSGSTTENTTKLKTTRITAVRKKKKTVTIKWKKVSGASGYEVLYSKKKASGYKKLTTAKAQKVTVKTGKKLKKGKTWYLKVRAYKVVNSTKVYSKVSKAKRVKL